MIGADAQELIGNDQLVPLFLVRNWWKGHKKKETNKHNNNNEEGEREKKNRTKRGRGGMRLGPEGMKWRKRRTGNWQKRTAGSFRNRQLGIDATAQSVDAVGAYQWDGRPPTVRAGPTNERRAADRWPRLPTRWLALQSNVNTGTGSRPREQNSSTG